MDVVGKRRVNPSLETGKKRRGGERAVYCGGKLQNGSTEITVCGKCLWRALHIVSCRKRGLNPSNGGDGIEESGMVRFVHGASFFKEVKEV